jgi:hypothetical protein
VATSVGPLSDHFVPGFADDTPQKGVARVTNTIVRALSLHRPAVEIVDVS